MALVTSLIVKLETSSDAHSGTDDHVYFGIGTREWLLDTDQDDFQPGAVQTFNLRLSPGLDTSHIQAIQLRKTGTDGWKPRSIEVWVNNAAMSGTPLYRGTIDMMLDGGTEDAGLAYGLCWEAPDYTGIFAFPQPFAHATDPAITSLEVEVTTAAGADAGTDDPVYFNIGTREWLLDATGRNDFQPGATDTFTLRNFGSLTMSHIRQIALRKEGDDSWQVQHIKVTANGAVLLDEAVGVTLHGGAGAELQHGKWWASRNYPHPSPQPVEDRITKLKVTVATTDTTYGATADHVYFNCGTREWTLGTPATSFTRNTTTAFELRNLGDLRLSDIRRIMIRKEGLDGFGLKSVKVEVEITNAPNPVLARTLYQGNASVFLDGGGSDSSNEHGLYWSAADYVVRVPVHCHWVVGTSAPIPQPRTSQYACSEVLRNCNTAAYRVGQGASNGYWHQARVQYHVVGFTQLATANANATLMPDSNDSWATMRAIATANNVANVVNAYFVRDTNSGSNWSVPPPNPSVWVQDTRNGAAANTTANFRMVAVSAAHELGHHFTLPHAGVQRYLMTGGGTNATSQLFDLTTGEDTTSHAAAAGTYAAVAGP